MLINWISHGIRYILFLRKTSSGANILLLYFQVLKDQLVIIEGVVLEALPDAKFKVKIDNREIVISAHASGRIRKNRVRILVGDRVIMEVNKHDKTNARITRRI